MTKNQDDFTAATFPEGHAHRGAGTYPFIQWVNGNKAFSKLHPVLASGGWAMPAANVLGALDWDRGELPHKNGQSTDAYLAPYLHAALLAEKFRWFKFVAGRTAWLPEYEDGARGKYQVLVAVQQAGQAQTTPWMLTATGMAGKALYEAVKAYRGKILPAASSIAGRRLPLYAFWLQLTAAAPRQVGTEPNTSVITPPALVLPDLSDRADLAAYLRGTYVGQQALDRFAGWFDEAQDWALSPVRSEYRAKAKFRTADGRPVSEHGEILDDGPAWPDDDENWPPEPPNGDDGLPF